MASPPRYRDEEDDPIDNHLELDQDHTPAAHPRWYRCGPKRLWGGRLVCWPPRTCAVGRERGRRIRVWVLIVVVVLTLLGVTAGLSAILRLVYGCC